MLFNKPIFFLFFLTCLTASSASHRYEVVADCAGLLPVVRKDERQVLVSTEFGQISAVNVSDGIGGQYHLQFITLEPNALFLPVVLHADMVFYVHTGSGSLSWSEVEADTTNNVDLQRGDVYALPEGSIFYLQSGLEPERTKLRIYAMFVNSNEPAFQEQILPMGAYSSIRDLLLGFDRKVLQAAFQASDEAMEELMNGEKLPPIVHATLPKKEEKKKGKGRENSIESRFMEVLMGSSRSYRMMLNFNDEMDNKKGKKKKKKTDTFNLINDDHDFENCNGWSVAVTSKNMRSLTSPNVGPFMVNLIRGAMMGPHWNPLATEVAIVLHGQGIILTVSSLGKRESCRIKVEEGDLFVVPRFSMMAQLAFNNDSFVFMGFSTTARKNHPQYSAGKASALQVLDRKVLALSFNVTNSTMDQILNPAVESIILECGSCAEEEERIMYEEIRKEEEEAAARKREEEEAAARKREEEEEEEARKREEEEEEEARKREEEEEEARKREEEARKREEEEEARKREEEEEARKREGEEEARKREEEEEARKREEEEEARKREEEEEEARKREEEARKREEEEARKWEEEEEEMKRKEEARKREEEARKREEEEEEMKRKEEARKRREVEEAMRKQEEEKAAKQEEEEARRQEEGREEAAEKREKEEESRKREKEAKRVEEEEEAARKEEE